MRISDIGLTAQQLENGQTVIAIGNEFITGGGIGIPVGGAFGFGQFAGTGFGANNFGTFLSYTGTASTYIKGLFDENFNHIPGEIPDNVFDKIKKFNELVEEQGLSNAIEGVTLESKQKSLSASTIFNYSDFLLYGFYSKKDKKYFVLKFEK